MSCNRTFREASGKMPSYLSARYDVSLQIRTGQVSQIRRVCARQTFPPSHAAIRGQLRLIVSAPRKRERCPQGFGYDGDMLSARRCGWPSRTAGRARPPYRHARPRGTPDDGRSQGQSAGRDGGVRFRPDLPADSAEHARAVQNNASADPAGAAPKGTSLSAKTTKSRGFVSAPADRCDLTEPGCRIREPRDSVLTASRTGTSGGPWPCRTSCARPRGCRG
jgi:hypothetical protein